MTVEELEIVITAKVEQALKEFKKIMPAIKQATQQMEEGINKIKADGFKEKINQAINTVKQKMASLKKQAENNKIAIKVNTQEASKQVSQLQKEIESIEKQISARQIKLNITNGALDKIRGETNQQVINEMPEAGTRRIRNETYKRLDNNENYNSLIKESDKLNSQIEKYNSLLASAKSKMSELNNEANKNGASQNRLTSLFSGLKSAMGKIKEPISQMGSMLKGKISGIMQGLTQKASNIGNSFKLGLGHVLKYATALFSLRGIYSILSSSAQSWLSSQNAGAQQLSANINYMKYALGSALAPVIQYVTNLVYELLKAIQSVVYALFRVNIFAKASASSMKSTAGSAKKAKEETKSLAGIHDEINNIGDKGTDSGGAGSGGGSPSFDLSGMDNQLSPLAQKLYDFFKPLKESWDKYGGDLIAQVKETAGQIGDLLSAVWGSFEKIITNGTIYTTLELILAIIGNIAEAFANAWRYNGNGDAIIQNIANALNNLLGAINDVVESEGFQQFLNYMSDKFREISDIIGSIDWDPLINAIFQIVEFFAKLAVNAMLIFTNVFKFFVEHPEIATALLAIVGAITAISNIISIAVPIIEGLHTACAIVSNVIKLLPALFSLLTSPIGIIIAIIGVLIATFVHLYKTNDEFREKVNNTWQNIVNLFKTFVMPVVEETKEFIVNILQTIWSVIKQLWDVIEPFIQDIFESILDWWNNTGSEMVASLMVGMEYLLKVVNWIWTKIINPIVQFLVDILKPVVGAVMGAIVGIVRGVLDSISACWNGVKGILNGIITFIKGVFSGNWRQAWEGVKQIFNSIASGLANSFKAPINFIIDVINGFIRGMNKIKMPDWIPGVGGKGFNIPQIPRLAKGGVIDSPTMALVGEYSGARTNPEIVTPESKMEDVFERVMSRHEGSGQPVRITVKYLGKEIFDDTIDYINGQTKRTGKNTIVMVGDS